MHLPQIKHSAFVTSPLFFTMYVVIGIFTKQSFSHFLHKLHLSVSTTGINRENDVPAAQSDPMTHKFRHIHRLSRKNPKRMAPKQS
jgi:hypothetical protein